MLANLIDDHLTAIMLITFALGWLFCFWCFKRDSLIEYSRGIDTGYKLGCADTLRREIVGKTDSLERINKMLRDERERAARAADEPDIGPKPSVE
jgi:hypothetical protein